MISRVLYFCLFIFSFSMTIAKAQKKRPNIILFMVDDMGWQDTSVPFWGKITDNNKKYHTPNMEKLASKGVKFTQAYAAPVCTPSRVSLVSGMNVARHGVTNWTSQNKNSNTDANSEFFDQAIWNINGCSPDINTSNTVHITPLPQILKDNGYFTINAGKAHFGSFGTPAADPKNLGFVINISGSAIGHPQSYSGQENYGNIAGKFSHHSVPDLGAYYQSDVFLNRAITLDALKALEFPLQQKIPFFLYLSHYAVHIPIMADSVFLKKYVQQGLPKEEANYASLVESMDSSLGQVLDFLEEKKIAKNTIIMFMSDNGGLGIEHPQGKATNHNNFPLKSGKGSVNEGGIREPMLVYWPGITKPESVCRQPIIIEDFFPSILEMAKIKETKVVQTIDGQSFVPFLKDPQKAKDRELVWYYPHNWGAGSGPGINYFAALRKGDFKVVWDMQNQKLSLYDIEKDISENRDLSKEMVIKTQEMGKQLQALLDQRHAPVLYYKGTQKPVRVTLN